MQSENGPEKSGHAGRLKRRDPKLTENYRKDEQHESFLDRFNESLLPVEQALMRDDLQDTTPILHVIGVPRAGTTLLTQAIVSGLSVGYINNLIARFWRVPVCGIHLARQLGVGCLASSFDSEFGRTHAVDEPHEFGYFWFSWLRFAEMAPPSEEQAAEIDWVGLRSKLINMCHAFDAPLVFKNFLVIWYMRQMQELMPRTCFVHIRRDPYENALSLLKFRRNMLGSEEQWASMKPSEYEWLKDEPFWVQVVGQVYFLEKLIEERCLEIDNKQILHLEFDDLCERPRETVARVAELLAENGADVSFRGNIPEKFNARKPSPVAANLEKKVRAAMTRFY